MSTELNQPHRSRRIGLFFFWLFLFLGVGLYLKNLSNSTEEVIEADRWNSTAAQINTLKVALSAFNKQTGKWPISKEGLQSLALPAPDSNTGIAKPIVKPTALVDLWGSEFQYAYPARRSKDPYDLWSMAADKRSGTEDDIGNWPATATAK